MRLEKQHVAAITRSLRIDSAGFSLQRAMFSPFIRAVNYHDVAPSQAVAFEAQLLYFTEHFEIVSPPMLEAFLAGSWRPSRPGLILTFDDGLRSHADVVAPLLERHGLVGWFMVPGGFVDALPKNQWEYAREHRILHAGHDYGDPRIAMTWEDARRLAAVHEVCCHTWSHCWLGTSLTPAEVAAEIPEAKKQLEAALARDVQSFAWVGGEESAYSLAAAAAIARAGFRFSFMTNNHVIQPNTAPLQLQRTNIEARDDMTVVRFQLSGMLDLMYWPKRRRVNRLTVTTRDR